MANGLTGAFDAVLQVRVETIDRILATLHQNGTSKDASPTVPHRLAAKLGASASIGDIAKWIANVLIDVPPAVRQETPFEGASHPADAPPSAAEATATEVLKRHVPPGASKVALDAIASWMDDLGHLTLSDRRGLARVQLSTPTVRIPPGQTSHATVHVDLRAHYSPDPGTAALPGPIHGEVQATFGVHAKPWSGGKRILEITPSANDDEIQFIPAPGTMTALAATPIAAAIRQALREPTEPTNVELPDDFMFTAFKGLGSGTSAVAVLPVDLPGGSAPGPSALTGLANVFVEGGDHFAVALGREYVESRLQALKDQLGAFSQTVPVKIWLPSPLTLGIPVPFTFDYHVSVSSVSLTWQTGHIVVTVKGKAVATDPAPDYSFTVTQKLGLALTPATQQLSLHAIGDPAISGLPAMAVGHATQAVKAARDAALQQAQGQIDALLAQVSLASALEAFNASATPSLTGADLRPDGVVLHGTVALPPRAPVHVEFTETGDGGVTAFKSWIPGGTIERYVWSWEKENPYFDVPHHHLEGATLKTLVEAPHDFVAMTPEEVPPEGRICLSVEGTQVPASGGPAQKVWGSACQVIWPALGIVVPIGWDVPMIAPMWKVGGDDNASLNTEVAAHVDVFRAAGRGSRGISTLVHFAGADASRPLEPVARALRERAKRDAPVNVVVVLPAGTLEGSRRTVEAGLGLSGDRRGEVILTEDYESGWTRTFGVESTPATYLLDASGAFVWHETGRPDAAAIAGVLDEHAAMGRRPVARPVQLAVRVGERAPDVLLELGRGERLALRKLLGRTVLMAFWKSWSAPCLAELERLQRLHGEHAHAGLTVLAINDGDTAARIDEVRRRHGLTLSLVPDPDRSITRRFGITCWPTTVIVDEAGRIGRVQLGRTPEPAGEPGRRTGEVELV